MGLNFYFFLLETAFFGESTGASEADLQILAEKTRAGDTRAEDALLRWALKRINEILRAKANVGFNDRQEIRQECCFEFWRGIKLGKYDSQRGKIGAYLWGIFNNQIKSYYRKKNTSAHRSVSLEAMTTEQSPGVDEITWELIGGMAKEIDMEEKEKEKRLHDCIERLPETQRLVVISTYFENESHVAAGNRVGKQAQQVAELKRLARARLKKCLDEYSKS